jgi:hypothetical protein
MMSCPRPTRPGNDLADANEQVDAMATKRFGDGVGDSCERRPGGRCGPAAQEEGNSAANLSQSFPVPPPVTHFW